MKAQLKSVYKAGSAANYVRPGSMNLTGKQDLFLYSHVNRVKRETKSSSSSGRAEAQRIRLLPERPMVVAVENSNRIHMQSSSFLAGIRIPAAADPWA